MTFDRNQLPKHYDTPKAYPFVNLKTDKSVIQGVYLGEELAIKRNWNAGRWTTPQIAQDGLVRTSRIVHLLLEKGKNFDTNAEDNLEGGRVRYEIKGGFQSVRQWTETLRDADIRHGDTVRITRVSSDPTRNNAGVFKFEVIPAKNYPSSEVREAVAELKQNFRSRQDLDTEAKTELTALQENAFQAPQPPTNQWQAVPPAAGYSPQGGYNPSVEPF